MRIDDYSQLPLVVPTPFEAAKYIEIPYQDLIQCFYVSIKGGDCVCVCVYTWDKCFLMSHVSIGVWEIGWLYENHRAVGALFGGGLLESAPDGGGLLEAKADVLVGCLSGCFCGWLTGWLAWWMVSFLVEWLATPLVGWLVVCLAFLFTGLGGCLDCWLATLFANLGSCLAWMVVA